MQIYKIYRLFLEAAIRLNKKQIDEAVMQQIVISVLSFSGIKGKQPIIAVTNRTIAITFKRVEIVFILYYVLLIISRPIRVRPPPPVGCRLRESCRGWGLWAGFQMPAT